MRTSHRLAFVTVLTCLGAMMGTVPAQSQPFAPLPLGAVSCGAIPNTPIVRNSNIASLQGDIIILCTNTPGVASAFVTTVPINLTALFANANATNNIDFGEGPTITDAVLVINENNSMAPVTTSSTPPPPPPQYGEIFGATQIRWDGVQLPVPGAPLDPSNPPGTCPGNGSLCNPLNTTLRMTSMRANVTGLSPANQVSVVVSIVGPINVPISPNVLNVGPCIGWLAHDSLAGRHPRGV